MPVDNGSGHDLPACLVIPSTTFHRHLGGGQRTAIIFEALQSAWPTTVVILGPVPIEEAKANFPGAAAVIVWPDIDLFKGVEGRLPRLMAQFQRYFFPATFYRPSPTLEARLAEVFAGPGPSLLVFRLFRTSALANAGRRGQGAQLVIVDVDDRDDQAAEARLRALCGDALTTLVLAPLCIRPLTRLLTARLRRAAAAWFATSQDAELPGVPTRLIENAPLAMPCATELTLPSTGDTILFVGPAYHPPNRNGMRWFLQECWPAIRQAAPGTRLHIVGGGNWRAVVDQLGAGEGVDVRGFIQDIAAEYAASRMAICPLQEGGGSKVKLVEACAYQRPVVATLHSVRGFAAELTDHVAQADTSAAFVDACLRLLREPGEADRRGAALRDAQQRLYSSAAIKQKIVAEVRSTIAAAATLPA